MALQDFSQIKTENDFDKESKNQYKRKLNILLSFFNIFYMIDLF